MKRILTAAIALPLLVVITIYSHWLFVIVVSLFAAAAADEFLTLGEKKGIGRPGRWFLIMPALVVVSFLQTPEWVVASLVAGAVVLMTVTTFGGKIDTGFGRVLTGLSCLVYCSLTLGFVILISPPWILVLLAIVWVGDAAAYYGGRALGRHLLAPKISPKKTVEGAFAGIAGSVIAGVIGGAWVLGKPWMIMVLISVVTAAAGQVGDLSESVLKRSAGVKDSSSILPGHGGILDRLDSLFFAAPIFYWLLKA